MKKNKCKWCKSEDARLTYRSIDGIVGSEYNCKSCCIMSSEFLILVRDKKKVLKTIEVEFSNDDLEAIYNGESFEWLLDAKEDSETTIKVLIKKENNES